MSQSPEPPQPPPWTPPSPPSWAPPYPASPGPVAGAGLPAGPPAAPLRRMGPLLLVGAAVAGVVVGMLASGLVVAALLRASAGDIGGTMADRIGTSVEDAIVEGTREATAESLEDMGAFEEDLLYPGGAAVGAPDRFPPVAPEGLGPDPVLDGYAQDCFGGELQACDDLMFESPPMSDYEEYAVTCGGRVKSYAVGSCTELE